eukprot:3514394-Amphidinium_carterae.1
MGTTDTNNKITHTRNSRQTPELVNSGIAPDPQTIPNSKQQPCNDCKIDNGMSSTVGSGKVSYLQLLACTAGLVQFDTLALASVLLK